MAITAVAMYNNSASEVVIIDLATGAQSGPAPLDGSPTYNFSLSDVAGSQFTMSVSVFGTPSLLWFNTSDNVENPPSVYEEVSFSGAAMLRGSYMYFSGTGSGSIIQRYAINGWMEANPHDDGFGNGYFARGEYNGSTQWIDASTDTMYFTDRLDATSESAVFSTPLSTGGAGTPIITMPTGRTASSMQATADNVFLCTEATKLGDPMHTYVYKFNGSSFELDWQLEDTVDAGHLTISYTGNRAIFDVNPTDIQVFNLDGGALITTLELASEFMGLSLSPDGQFIYARTETEARVLQTDTLSLVRSVPQEYLFLAWLDVGAPPPTPPFWTNFRSAYEVIES